MTLPLLRQRLQHINLRLQTNRIGAQLQRIKAPLMLYKIYFTVCALSKQTLYLIAPLLPLAGHRHSAAELNLKRRSHSSSHPFHLCSVYHNRPDGKNQLHA
ncbi:hypothetical protein D3C78_1172550 [compost metagenome]